MADSKSHSNSPLPDVTPPPEMQVVQMALGGFVTRALYALAELGIADHFENGPLSAEDIARATNTHAPFLYRLLRNMTGFGFFIEDENHRFSLTPMGATLQSRLGYVRSSVRTLAGSTVWRSLDEIVHSIETGEACVKKAFKKPYFDHLRENPKELSLFNETMIGIHGDEPPAIAQCCDFSETRRLIDIGGGTGSLLAEILRENPKLDGVLYELPEVADEARRNIAAEGLTKRCKVVEGDFFRSCPTGGDAYILSHIIHDWDEEKCLRILENCHTAMQGRGRLLIIEQIIPPDNSFHPGKVLDLIMLTMHSGQERTQDEYAALLKKASFQLERTISTTTPASVMEAFPV